MASIKQNKTGTWTAAIDLKGVRAKKTWPTEADAREWANREERRIYDKAVGKYVAPTGSVGDLVKRYVADYGNAKGGWSRAKQYNLDMIEKDIGHVMVADFTAQTLIAYGKQIGKKPDGSGRGPVGVAERLNYLSKIFKVALPAWNIDAPTAEISKGMAVLREQGIVGETDARDRRIEAHEIAKIKAHLGVVMHDIVDVLMILPFRVSELCAIKWGDFNEIDRSVRLFRKDTSPKKKTFQKTQWVTLPVIEVVKDGAIVEVDTFDLLFKRDRSGEGPFPIDGASASRMFSQAHGLAGVEDIHLHDCRSEAMSNLFAQGFDVSIVCHLSGHKDWKTVQEHYARLKPRKLHELFKRQARINQQARAA